MKTSKTERDYLRDHANEFGSVNIVGDMAIRLLDDADRAEDLERKQNAKDVADGERIKTFVAQAVRISALEAALRKVDEIRRELKDSPVIYTIDTVVMALEAPCMAVWK
jgi:hypothetical protein